ncbi:serine/threonine-protein kinase [Streptosporangium sp. NBC_01469]|uniref:serine/threonine-protein kinase n=1 Tax=Streptosporangium sp. NBC_01469 TaxID=2903898 RepID=UPI002E2DEAD0|nr:protein kinase [Streptosporangium sp. NBC_01469]
MNQPGVEGLRPADPEQIGSYRLLGRLGEGGMGTVYLALAPTGRPVALKVVKAEFAIEDGFAARFHTEVENARRVASFCTAQVLDNGNDDGRPYMVTEYIAGTPLSRQIIEHGALEQGTLHGVALGVAAALAAIHVAGLVHRDLKPANVILSMSGPRVIDFGIARALDSTHSFTRSGEVLGSPGWWAPEQVRGLEITPAADVFAWGCMVAYAGNGRHPYGRGDMMTMATRLLTTPPDLGALPAPLNDLVRLATEMDPYQRPSAQDLLIALVGGGIAAPAAPAPVRADPPTLIATDMLNESWEPPANVEPDSTQTLSALNLEAGFADPATAPTPIPGLLPGWDPAASASVPAPSAPGAPPSPPESPAPSAPGPSTTPAAAPGSRTTPAPLTAPTAPPGSPGPQTAPERTPPPNPLPYPMRAEPTTSPSRPFTSPLQARPSGQEPRIAPGQAPGRAPGHASAQAQGQAQGQVPTLPPSPLSPLSRPSPSTGLQDPPGSDAPDTGRSAPRRRWLFAGLAVLAALAVTVVVLLNTGGGNANGDQGQARPGTTGDLAGTGGTDVGRTITTGSFIEDPRLIIPRTPACGLTSYGNATPVNGRFCTVPLTLINTGAELVPLGDTTAITLTDDRGGTHKPERVSTALPAALPPGTKVEAVLVFDLPPARRPAKLTGVVIEGGRNIEVRLS